MKTTYLAGVAALVLAGFTVPAPAAEYFVAPDGSDAHPGTAAQPFQTIQKAADVMQAGDTCTIRAGVYREWVKPPRGGASEARRITYRAAPGETVVVRGSERITTWKRGAGDVWTAELPDAFFGAFNPFKTNLAGDWLHYGKEFHLGAVYLEGWALREKPARADLEGAAMAYWIEDRPGATVLHARFDGRDPNALRTEIHVRECVFAPVVPGLGFITVDGLTIEHASANWAAWRQAQRGAVSTGWGWRWIIQNCRVQDARCVGIVCGNAASGENEGFDLTRVGGHIVRNNHIRRCGQAAIHGFKGWAGSVIERNLIEDINVRREFGGEETGGIKIHSPVDITIRNNVLRRIYARRVPGKNNDFVALWIDWAGQGTRVTGNVVYDNEAWALYLQNNHGSPLVIDNNVFAGTMATSSSGCVFAHNLYVDCPWVFIKPYALVSYWKPHTAELAATAVIAYGNDHHLNNIYVGRGSEAVPNGSGVQVDWNVLYGGAKRSAWGDRRSLVNEVFNPGVKFTDLPDGVEIRFRADPLPQLVKGPLITPEFIGIFALTGQKLEHPDGKPLTLDRDLLGQARNRDQPVAGPFERLRGENVFRLIVGPKP